MAKRKNQQRPIQRIWQRSVSPWFLGMACIGGNFLAAPSLSTAQDMKLQELPGVVQPVGFNAELNRGNVTIAANYRLQRSTCEQFERKLVDMWLSHPRYEILGSGKQVRVEVPNQVGSAAMVIDRSDSTVSFYGPEKVALEWKGVVARLDQIDLANPQNTAMATSLNGVEPQFIKQVSYLMGFEQLPQTPDNTNPAPQLPGGIPQNPDDPTRIGTIYDETQQGPVTIEVLPELNMILISGRKADVDRVKAEIEKIMKTADLSAPKIERILLANGQPNDVATQVLNVYNNIYFNNLGPVSVEAIQNPRALVVVGRDQAVAQVRELIEQFDRPDDEPPLEKDFRTFNLVHMSAIDAKTRLDAYFGQLTTGAQAPQSLPVVTIPDMRSNVLIVKASKNLLDQAAELIKEIDVDQTASTKEVRVFRLRNTVAGDIQTILQNAINGQFAPYASQGFNPNQQQILGNQQGQQLFNQTQPNVSLPGTAALQLKTIDRDGQEVRSGILFDVRISADANSNSLIVTGPTSSMRLIETLIEQLDRLPDAETQIKVFQVTNGDAPTLLTMLQTLFGGGNQQNQQFAQFGAAQTGLSTLPLQSASAVDGATLVNLRFAVDERTNTIVASGPVSDLEVVESLLTRLDENDLNQRQVYVYRLSNASVSDISEAVNNWLTARQTQITSDPTFNSPIIQVRREINVIPEVVSNSLIISAWPEHMNEAIQVVQALDRRPPVVKVKVLIAEVNLTMLEEFGVEVGLQDSLLFDRGIGNIGFPFNQSGLGNNNTPASLATRESLAGQALSNLGTGRVNSDLGYGGLVLSAGNESINLLLRALKDKKCVRVLNKPFVMTLEGSTASLQVGAKVPRVTSVNQTNFGISNGVELTDIGVILQISPRVSEDGMIFMFVDVTKSSLGPEATGIPIFVNANGDATRSPIINTTTANTTLMARSGQTVVFSGLIQEEKSRVERATPFLSDIPYLGELFKFQNERASRNELLIVLTPYLADSEDDIEAHNHEEMDRMHWCLSDVAEIYGSTNYDDRAEMTAPVVIFPDNDPTGRMARKPSNSVEPIGVQGNNPAMGNRPVGYEQPLAPTTTPATKPTEEKSKRPLAPWRR